MKKQIFLISTIGTIILATSCIVQQEYRINKNMLPIEFKPLSPQDFSIQKNLSAEITLQGKFTKTGKVYTLKQNDKKMSIYSIVPDELSPYLTGNLTNENVVNVPLYSESAVAVRAGKLLNILGISKKDVVTSRILPHHFAFVALVEKYPDIDYFTNVRFDSKVTIRNKEFTETVKIIADGIELRTDD